MKIRHFTVILVIAGLLAACAGYAQQGPPPPGQFKQMQERNKFTFQLMDTVKKVAEINKDSKYALSPDQAKKVLAILKPLRSKPKLTQAQAKSTLISLKKVLTVKQLNAMAKIKDTRRGPGGPGGIRPGGPPPGGFQGPPPPGSPGTPPPPSGMKRPPDMNAVKDFNPFYVKPGTKAGPARQLDPFFKSLEQKAKKAK